MIYSIVSCTLSNYNCNYWFNLVFSVEVRHVFINSNEANKRSVLSRLIYVALCEFFSFSQVELQINHLKIWQAKCGKMLIESEWIAYVCDFGLCQSEHSKNPSFYIRLEFILVFRWLIHSTFVRFVYVFFTVVYSVNRNQISAIHKQIYISLHSDIVPIYNRLADVNRSCCCCCCMLRSSPRWWVTSIKQNIQLAAASCFPPDQLCKYAQNSAVYRVPFTKLYLPSILQVSAYLRGWCSAHRNLFCCACRTGREKKQHTNTNTHREKNGRNPQTMEIQ